MSVSHECENCGADGSVYLHSKCHPKVPTWAVLSGDVLTIECAACQKVLARFRVISEEES
jgi:phage FluMu protein Com